MKTLSIIGFGSFSALMIKYLQDDFKIVVSSRNPDQKDPFGLKFRFVGLQEALGQEIIILGIAGAVYWLFPTN